MTLDEFAAITKRVIARDGFAGYQPTVCLPGRRFITVIEGIPPELDLETALLDWCTANAADEECVFAFRTEDSAFKVVRRDGKTLESAVYSAT